MFLILVLDAVLRTCMYINTYISDNLLLQTSRREKVKYNSFDRTAAQSALWLEMNSLSSSASTLWSSLY